MGIQYEGFLWKFLNQIRRGVGAVVVQNYIEANVKNGVQFEFSNLATLAASASSNAILLTGAKPIIIKAREIRFTSTGVTSQIFEAPTYTGGTPSAIRNMNRINPVATTVQILGGVTVTADGTEIASPTYGVGGVGQGNSTGATFAVQGAERVLKPNTAYLFRITNRDTTNPANVATYSTWYEGDPDLPIT